MENKKDKEEKCKGKRMNKIIIGIVSAIVLVAVVATVGIGYKKNEVGKGYANNDANEMKENIDNEVVENEEIKTGNNGISDENDLGIKLSNYVVAGSEEARRNEEILKKVQKEKERIEKNKEKSKVTKYAGLSTVQLASNAGNTRDIRSAVQEIATTNISSGTLTLSQSTYTYNGQRNTPDPTLIVGGKTLILGKDYTIEYTSNIDAGMATATARGINEYTGTKTANFTIKPAQITVTWQGGDRFIYSGSEQKPTVQTPVAGVNGDKVYLKVKIQGGTTAINAGNYTAEAEVNSVVKGSVRALPGTITVTSKITKDSAGNTAAGSNVTKGTQLYIQITATQTNGTIKSIYSAQNTTKVTSTKYTLPITENGTYGFAVVGSENTSKWQTVTVDNYAKVVPIGEIEIGDYVKYIPDTGSGTWRVWAKEGSNVIITPVGGIGSLTLSGANDWLDAETKIEAECDKYKSTTLGITASNIRSMKIEDIEKVMPASEVSSVKSRNRYGIENSYESGKFYAEVATSSSGTFDGYNKALTDPKTASSSSSVKLKLTAWYENDPMWDNLENKKSGMTSDTYGTILWDTWGWLASRCVFNGTTSAGFCVFMSSNFVGNATLYSSDVTTNSWSHGVRPLVSLSSTLFAGGGAGTSSDPWQLSK